MPSPQSKSASPCHPAPQNIINHTSYHLPFMHEDQQQPGQPRWGGVSTCGSGFQFTARRQKPQTRTAACKCADKACKSTGQGMSGLVCRSCTREAAAFPGRGSFAQRLPHVTCDIGVRLHVPCSCSPCRVAVVHAVPASTHSCCAAGTTACTVQAPAYTPQ